MNILPQIKTVLWSLIGIGRRKDMEDISQRGSPGALLLVAFGLAIVFVVTLVFLAKAAAGT